MAAEGLVALDPPERKRTYYFPNHTKLEIDNVTHLEVTGSKNHRLVTESGQKYFVSPNWLYIELDVDGWTF